MSIDTNKSKKDKNRVFKCLNCYSQLKNTLSEFNKNISNYKCLTSRNQTPYRNIKVYYKDPFFYNDNNLDMQLNVLKSLEFLEIKNKKEFDESKEHKESIILPKITKGIVETNNSVILRNNSNIKSANSVNISHKNNDLKKVNDLIFYRTIFKGKNIFKKQKAEIVDNKLNMKYAENEEQYKELVEKENKKLMELGKPIKIKTLSKLINLKIKDAKSKIKFMKGVVDYSYPSFVLSKIKNMENRIKKINNSSRFNNLLTPVEIRNKEKSVRNRIRKEYLMNSIICLKK